MKHCPLLAVWIKSIENMKRLNIKKNKIYKGYIFKMKIYKRERN